jgi:hypothetical protein
MLEALLLLLAAGLSQLPQLLLAIAAALKLACAGCSGWLDVGCTAARGCCLAASDAAAASTAVCSAGCML